MGNINAGIKQIGWRVNAGRCCGVMMQDMKPQYFLILPQIFLNVAKDWWYSRPQELKNKGPWVRSSDIFLKSRPPTCREIGHYSAVYRLSQSGPVWPPFPKLMSWIFETPNQLRYTSPWTHYKCSCQDPERSGGLLLLGNFFGGLLCPILLLRDQFLHYNENWPQRALADCPGLRVFRFIFGPQEAPNTAWKRSGLRLDSLKNCRYSFNPSNL